MTVDEALERSTDRLMSLPGVMGVGVGERDGSPAVVIFVGEVTPEVKGKLPDTLDGYPVVVERSGEITAF
jgi:hypothetical protein